MKRIVAVDNDSELLALLGEVFTLEGWELIPCQRASDALRVIEQEQPEVVLLDVWLETPTSGFDVLQELSGSPLTSSIPVICCTGATEELRGREAWLRERCGAILYKPFDIDQLCASVEAAASPSPGKGTVPDPTRVAGGR